MVQSRDVQNSSNLNFRRFQFSARYACFFHEFWFRYGAKHIHVESFGVFHAILGGVIYHVAKVDWGDGENSKLINF